MTRRWVQPPAPTLQHARSESAGPPRPDLQQTSVLIGKPLLQLVQFDTSFPSAVFVETKCKTNMREDCSVLGHEAVISVSGDLAGYTFRAVQADILFLDYDGVSEVL